MQKVLTFFAEVKGELMKVNWPTRDEVVRHSVAVVVITAAVAVFLGGLDYFFSFIVKDVIAR